MKPLPEAAEFAALREKHAHEWPDDVKQAAAQFAANLTAAHLKSFQAAKPLTEGLAKDWADFQAKLAAWRASQRGGASVEIAGIRTPDGLVTDFEVVAEHSMEIRDGQIIERERPPRDDPPE